MGAICGFTGPADHRLQQAMISALAHRHRFPAEAHATEHGTAIYLPRGDTVERARLGTGICSEDSETLAVSGLLTDPPTIASGLGRVLHNVRTTGLAALEALRGDFVAVAFLKDKQGRGVCHLVRDAAGARSVYHASYQGRLVFASEPKAIWSLPGFSRRIRAASIAQYFTFSFVPGAPTMLEEIEELPPGCALTHANHETQVHRYFRFEEDEPQPADLKSGVVNERDADRWSARTRECLAEGIARRLPPDEAPAVFLSGGLDSSVVTCELARQSSRQVSSYALHFGRRYPNELEYAAAVAQRCGTRHHEIEIRPHNFLPQLRRMIWHLDDPIGDPITMPNMQLAQRVAGEHRWVFNGEGGDPCFGGPKNIPMLIGHWYGSANAQPGMRERAYLSSYRRGYEVVQHLLTPEWNRQIDQHRDLESILTPFFQTPCPQHFINKLFAINIRLKGAHLILPKVERMLAAAQISPLAPLFSAEMVRLSFQMPPLMKMCRGDEKVALKRAYAKLLPRQIITRPKSGMRVPVHFWFQGEMRRYARSLLSPRRIKQGGIFNPDLVRRLLAYDLETRQGRYGLRLWMLMTFEIWRRIVVEGEPL